MIPKEAVEEFKCIYKKEFGVEINDKEAYLRASNLVNLYKAVCGDNSNQNDPTSRI